MGGLFRKKGPRVEYRFLPRYPRQPMRMVTEQKGNAIGIGAVGSSQWFNPRSPSDLALTLYPEPPALAETDGLDQLKLLRETPFIIYQHWWEPGPSGSRPVGAMKADQVEPIAAALRGSKTRNLMLVTAGFVEKSIARLGLELQGHDLDYLGLCWYFSGDDISDVPSAPAEIVETCKLLKVRRLAILTGAFNGAIEKKLADGLGKLEACGIFRKDDAARYPRFPTPLLDRLCR